MRTFSEMACEKRTSSIRAEAAAGQEGNDPIFLCQQILTIGPSSRLCTISVDIAIQAINKKYVEFLNLPIILKLWNGNCQTVIKPGFVWKLFQYQEFYIIEL